MLFSSKKKTNKTVDWNIAEVINVLFLWLWLEEKINVWTYCLKNMKRWWNCLIPKYSVWRKSELLQRNQLYMTKWAIVSLHVPWNQRSAILIRLAFKIWEYFERCIRSGPMQKLCVSGEFPGLSLIELLWDVSAEAESALCLRADERTILSKFP